MGQFSAFSFKHQVHFLLIAYRPNLENLSQMSAPEEKAGVCVFCVRNSRPDNVTFKMCVCVCVCVCACVRTQSCLTLCDPMSSPPSASVHGFPRQEHWGASPFPPPGDLPDPGVKLYLLCLLHWYVDSLPLSHQGSKCILLI